jgi:hypothetical protein
MLKRLIEIVLKIIILTLKFKCSNYAKHKGGLDLFFTEYLYYKMLKAILKSDPFGRFLNQSEKDIYDILNLKLMDLLNNRELDIFKKMFIFLQVHFIDVFLYEKKIDCKTL